MGKMCVECLTRFENSLITSRSYISNVGIYQTCPISMCKGKVYEINDMILPAIEALNAKGFTTYASSGGNGYSGEGVYVEFSENVESLDSIPELFTERMNGERIVIECISGEEDPYDAFHDDLIACENLFVWAMELENRFLDEIIMFISGEKISPKKKNQDKKDLRELFPEGKVKIESIRASSKDKKEDD